MIKVFIKKNIIKMFQILNNFNFFKTLIGLINIAQFESFNVINFKDFKIKLINPNNINNWRIKTFKTKEPETLDWIDSFHLNSCFWDIGANIGMYSIYAAKKFKNLNVISFEPSVFNLEVLARNIFINNLNNISIMSLPIFNKNENNTFSMSNTDWGGALSNFGANKNWEGKTMDTLFQYKTFSLNPETLISFLNLTPPDYLKIDVDGVDNIILKSFGDKIKKIKSILIEVNDNFIEQRDDVESFLLNNNFKLEKKEQSELIKKFPKTFHNSYNQIWINNDV